MGVRSLLKVRQPGHGSKFEGRVKAAISEARVKVFPSKSVPESSMVNSKKVKVG